jgi:hypothetical protein
VNAGVITDEVKVGVGWAITGDELLTRRFQIEGVVIAVCDEFHIRDMSASIKAISEQTLLAELTDGLRAV